MELVKRLSQERELLKGKQSLDLNLENPFYLIIVKIMLFTQKKNPDLDFLKKY